MIYLSSITRIFQMGDQEVRALNGINLKIASGEYVSIMGPSGSGKSTLLNIIGLLDRADIGRYELDGNDVTSLSEIEQARVRREKIGFVFQSFHLVPRLTAAENIELPLMLDGVLLARRKLRVKEGLLKRWITFYRPQIAYLVAEGVLAEGDSPRREVRRSTLDYESLTQLLRNIRKKNPLTKRLSKTRLKKLR